MISDPKKEQPCGSWPSPFTPQIVTGKNIQFSELSVDGNDIYWLERRPEAQGKTILVRWNEAEGLSDITSSEYDIGNRVHEYGGGAYQVRNRTIVFSDRTSNAIWLLDKNQKPRVLFQDSYLRFADFCLTDHFVIAIQEDHHTKEVKNSLVAIPLDPTNTFKPIILIDGADFYSAPRLSPNGSHLLWIQWSHPFMPWESTQLGLAKLENITKVISKEIIAGQNQQESLIEPGWLNNQQFLVCSDRNNWWNLYQGNTDNPSDSLQAIAPMQAEIGLPQWVFGQRNWYKLSSDTIIARRLLNGISETILIKNKNIKPVDMGQPENCPVPFHDGQWVWINTPQDEPAQIVLQNRSHRQILKSANRVKVAKDFISVAEPIKFPTQDGQSAHAFFYAPKHKDYCPCRDELSPLLVMAHGGPTGQSFPSFNSKIQWWTSRGFAVVDVNYRGSTGFGRPYREALNKQWGIIDVQDCIDVCHYLIHQKRVDPKRIVIRGSSAGGFTVLTALIRSDIFAGGACLYGVGDLTALAQETHKFESHYLDGLIGPYPQEKQTYHDRSPLTHLNQLRRPLIVFQGLKDVVVSPAQAECIVEKLKTNQIPYAYYFFPDEGHGFKQENTINRVMELELAFYGKILGFKPYGLSEDVLIHNDNTL